MAKIRGIKPDYWTDEDIVDLSIAARLLFIGLWTYACDNGHLQDKSKQIKMRVLPGDDVNCADLLRELATAGRIQRLNGWITIPHFTKHQKPDKRYFQTCDMPGCLRPGANPERETRGGHGETTTSARSGHGVASWGPHVDGDGEGESEGDGEGVEPASKLGGPRRELAVVGAEVTTQSLVGEWIDHCDERPPGRVVGQISKELKALLDEGIDPDRIRRALAEWNRKGLHPSTLPSVVHEIANKTPATTNRQAAEAAMWERAMDRAIEREREMGLRP